jgi:hypothetical protein
MEGRKDERGKMKGESSIRDFSPSESIIVCHCEEARRSNLMTLSTGYELDKLCSNEQIPQSYPPSE